MKAFGSQTKSTDHSAMVMRSYIVCSKSFQLIVISLAEDGLMWAPAISRMETPQLPQNRNVCLGGPPRLHPEESGVEVAHRPVFIFSNNGVWASFFSLLYWEALHGPQRMQPEWVLGLQWASCQFYSPGNSLGANSRALELSWDALHHLAHFHQH